MAPQDGLYTVVSRDGDRSDMRVIGAVRDVMVAPEDPARLVDALASPDTAIVTLTVTEKGYKLDPATGTPMMDDPDVRADMASLAAPRTAPGFLVAGLARRKQAGLAPFTAISCDNLPHNGERLRSAVLAMAFAHDPTLADWIAQTGAFPNSMVDRIVPATTEDDIVELEARAGLRDMAMVKTEPFSQWVIEDRFCGPRPDFEALGVQVTDEVGPWEAAKLRLLNGAHSAIAYLGGMAGLDFVHQAAAREDMAHFIHALWDEAESTLSPPAGLDIAAYRDALWRRFRNSALQHRTRQIAMDGSQKIPQRLLAPIAALQARGKEAPALTLAVAGWIRWLGGTDDLGQAHAIEDPMAPQLAEALADARTGEERVAAVLAIESIFPPALASGPFRSALARQLSMLTEWGALETLRRAGAPGQVQLDG